MASARQTNGGAALGTRPGTPPCDLQLREPADRNEGWKRHEGVIVAGVVAVRPRHCDRGHVGRRDEDGEDRVGKGVQGDPVDDDAIAAVVPGHVTLVGGGTSAAMPAVRTRVVTREVGLERDPQPVGCRNAAGGGRKGRWRGGSVSGPRPLEVAVACVSALRRRQQTAGVDRASRQA
jgi:hypothetical protein